MNKTKTQQRIYGKFKTEAPEVETSNVILHRLENGKRYAHTAISNYRIMMASLQPDAKRAPNCHCSRLNEEKGPKKDEDKVIVIIEHDLKEYILCILDSKKLPQCKLDILIQRGEQIAYRTIGKTPVQLSGAAF